jgi:hypothetical protein
MEIIKFDPTIEELNKLVTVSKKIKVTDINDKKQIEVVRENRIILKTARVAITKRGKELREEALAFQRNIISQEKELIAIIEPEEERLSAIEEEVKQKQLIEERKALLPTRREQLDAIGDGMTVTDDVLLDMDTETFSAYKNERVAQKNESDRLAIETEKRKVQEEAERQQREKETQEREKRAREEAQAEAERKLALAKEEAEMRIQREKEEAERRVIAERERIEREQKEKEARELQEKAEAAARAKAEQEVLEKKKKYQAWLTKNDYSESTHYLRNEGGVVTLYKIISTFKI